MTQGRKIPFNDLRTHHQNHRQVFHDRLDELLDSSAYVGGGAIAEFESEFASFCGVSHCAGTGNGTDAIVAALKALGIGPGDCVVTVPNTFIATTEAITQTGAEIIFVDVNEDDLLIDLNQLENLIHSHPKKDRIRCVLPVHLFGQPVDLPRLQNILAPHDIKIVADSAQAHGALIDGEPISRLADLSTFSFYPGKNLGALGDGGAVVSSQSKWIDDIKSFCNHGRSTKYHHRIEGINSRLDTLQAMFLREKLTRLGENTQKRQNLSHLYDLQFKACPEIQILPDKANRASVVHLYVIRHASRDELAKNLSAAGIQTGIHYPVPLHLLPAYQYMELDKGSFPVAEKAAESILSLPLYPEMPEEDIDFVSRKVKELQTSL